MIAVPARYRALFLLSASPRDDMSAVLDNPRPRINHSMLLQHIGRPVCFVGRVEKVSPNGKTFTVADGESRTVTVELNEPVRKFGAEIGLTVIDFFSVHFDVTAVKFKTPLCHDGELNGVVEVVGMVSNKGVLMATTYSMLQEAKGVPFDLELYNEAVKIIRDFPQHYPFHVAASG